jgi:hypothetical protein
MEELVEILIRLIAGLLKSSVAPAAPPRANPPPLPNTITMAAPGKKMRRPQGRRPLPATVAVARPIVTSVPPPPLPTASAKPPVPAAAEVTTRPTSTASADRLRKWLTPANLQAQFLFTEILQPPLALRDDRKY